MKTRKATAAKRGRQTLPISLVLAIYAGLTFPGTEVLAAGPDSVRSLAAIQSAAARCDAEAMYWLAMLHIEGRIRDANYDRGVQLLMASAEKGNKDAKRMYAFMDNAFSGDGC